MNYDFQIRVTGVLIEKGEILLVKQKVSKDRMWSLPGGRLEQGETIREGLQREFWEETGLEVQVQELLYLCDVKPSSYKVIHITFLVSRTGGTITLPTNEKDENPIFDVKFVPIAKLTDYGFSSDFQKIVENKFPQKGNYMGDKENIGLGISMDSQKIAHEKIVNQKR